MRCFLDANVLFSAAHSPTSRARVLFALNEARACTLLSSGYALEEARRNLALKRPESAAVLEQLLRQVEIVQEGSPEIIAWAQEQGLPADDAPILAAAALAKADILVTGDRTHFGFLFGQDVRGTRVLSLAETLARMLDVA
jgi:uncharacterized protein